MPRIFKLQNCKRAYQPCTILAYSNYKYRYTEMLVGSEIGGVYANLQRMKCSCSVTLSALS